MGTHLSSVKYALRVDVLNVPHSSNKQSGWILYTNIKYGQVIK
jgi:hypothetical protein